MPPSSIDTTSLGPSDRSIVQWALYEAVRWNNPPGIPPQQQAIEHPEMRRYHDGWGREGDFGVRASIDGEFVGAAFGRLFSDDDHGHGYVDEDTPEIGISVVSAHRGSGVGTQLMNALADEARKLGMGRLSLSVNNPNPAKRLYERLGYVEVDDDGDSTLMVLEL